MIYNFKTESEQIKKILLTLTYIFLGLARGARYIFTFEGTRIYRLEELEDGKSYVAASDRKFVVRTLYSFVYYIIF